MPHNNQIQIDGNGNITLQNIEGSTITITKGDDANTIIEKLNQLQEVQLDALQQIVEMEGKKLEDLLKQTLQEFAKTKGVEKGAFATMQEHNGSGDNVAGDKKVYHFEINNTNATIHQQNINSTVHNNYSKEEKTNRDLTENIPRIEDLTKIIGRDKDLTHVRDLLVEKQKVVVVNGLGGIGKTTLAQAYLTRYADEYAHILWLTQSEGDNFVLDLITAQGLTHNLGIATEGKDTQTLFIEILSKIKSITAKPNLWVIDNANASLHRYFNYLPKPPNWHILATSREKMEHFFAKDLDFLSEEDAILLFNTHCQRITDCYNRFTTMTTTPDHRNFGKNRTAQRYAPRHPATSHRKRPKSGRIYPPQQRQD